MSGIRPRDAQRPEQQSVALTTVEVSRCCESMFRHQNYLVRPLFDNEYIMSILKLWYNILKRNKIIQYFEFGWLEQNNKIICFKHNSVQTTCFSMWRHGPKAHLPLLQVPDLLLHHWDNDPQWILTFDARHLIRHWCSFRWSTWHNCRWQKTLNIRLAWLRRPDRYDKSQRRPYHEAHAGMTSYKRLMGKKTPIETEGYNWVSNSRLPKPVRGSAESNTLLLMEDLQDV